MTWHNITHPSDLVGAEAFLFGLACICVGLIAWAWDDLRILAWTVTAARRSRQAAQHIGATINWSPVAEIADQTVSTQLMTVAERVEAIRTDAAMPVDEAGEKVEVDILAAFDRLIDGIVGQLPDDERLAHQQYSTRIRSRGLRRDDTGSFDRYALEAMLASQPALTDVELAQAVLEEAGVR